MSAPPVSGPAVSRLFDSVTQSDRDALLAMATRRSLRRGESVFRQGDPATTLYLVGRGYLKLTQVTAEGSELIIRFAGPGEPVGGVAALGKALYPITATACDMVDVVGWARPRLEEMLVEHPSLKTNVMREMSAHMGEALMRMGDMATERVGQRLARTLLRLAHHCGHHTSLPLEIPHALTRQELAALAGTTLFTVSRILTDWEAVGLVRSARARVELRDIPSLRRLAEDGTDPTTDLRRHRQPSGASSVSRRAR
jgi:CRP-like cAMP-binding protein